MDNLVHKEFYNDINNLKIITLPTYDPNIILSYNNLNYPSWIWILKNTDNTNLINYVINDSRININNFTIDQFLDLLNIASKDKNIYDRINKGIYTINKDFQTDIFYNMLFNDNINNILNYLNYNMKYIHFYKKYSGGGFNNTLFDWCIHYIPEPDFEKRKYWENNAIIPIINNIDIDKFEEVMNNLTLNTYMGEKSRGAYQTFTSLMFNDMYESVKLTLEKIISNNLTIDIPINFFNILIHRYISTFDNIFIDIYNLIKKSKHNYIYENELYQDYLKNIKELNVDKIKTDINNLRQNVEFLKDKSDYYILTSFANRLGLKSLDTMLEVPNAYEATIVKLPQDDILERIRRAQPFISMINY